MTKAAGYIRVSSKEQIEGESLSTQRQSIKNYCKANGYKLTKIYADEGISGGTVSERHALLQCMEDGKNEKFETLIIHRLSRFGRNARELLNNQEELNNAGIQLRSISEGIDFGNKYGKAMLGMFAVMAELERDIIKEQMLENRIARAKKGIPTVGKFPFARSFNKKTEKWELDQEKAKLIQWAADEYLNGGSLREISEILRTKYKQPLGYHYLITVLTQKSGDTWTLNFVGEDPITYEIPRILDDETIQKVKERLEHNRIECRKDVRKYVLTGFLRCEECGKSLSGQTQVNRFGTEFKYYNHPGGKFEKCKAFNSIRLKQIETAVFKTIFENMVDVPAFEKAIADSLPDEGMIKGLQKQLKTKEKELRRLEKELDKLVDLALSGTLEKETIKQKEQSLLQAKATTKDELDQIRDKLHSMPDSDQIKQDAEQIRIDLLHRYRSQEHLDEMTFDEKKELLHFLFDGKDQKGTPYGIYVNKRGTGTGAKVDYFMYGRITGLRTLKGDDINYQNWDEDEEDEEVSTTKGSYNGNKVYKTSKFTRQDHHDLHPHREEPNQERGQKPPGF